MMEDFEDQLRSALRKQDPSVGFADRVLARTKPAKRIPSRRPIWTFAAIAAVLVVMIAVNREVQVRRAETASQQAVLALRITAEKLNAVRGKVLRRDVRTAETEKQ